MRARLLVQTQDTLVFLASDNGPFLEEGWDKRGRTGILKGGKGVVMPML